jgi:YD repeat-containing protein
MINCSSEKLEKVVNPNAKEYSRIVINQEDKELEKIKNFDIKERRVSSKFTDNIIKSGGKEVLVEKITFNEDGNKTEQFRFRADAIDAQWLYDYDEYGNEKLIEAYDGFQGLLNRVYFEYEYDDKYNLQKINLLDNHRVLRSNSFYKYTEERLDSVLYYNKYSLVKTITFQYDSLNRLQKETTLLNNKIIDLVTYGYDRKGNIIDIITAKVSHQKYSYDSAGNLTEEIHLDQQGNLQSRNTYEYDPVTGLLNSKTRYDGSNIAALEIRYEYDFR